MIRKYKNFIKLLEKDLRNINRNELKSLWREMYDRININEFLEYELVMKYDARTLAEIRASIQVLKRDMEKVY